ncbi:alanine racemase [Pelagibaculum spongiae]|uniref:Alanine racemase n=1 Tax=Pelagibaculum spongiae TaxID=2080658 RepID=A0A2V1GQ87_9GAMM|nr:alanine racemase [Pelagibaculum spongiae]PVZ65632.1 alanine racemase [Pelagibaculum spongiae]
MLLISVVLAVILGAGWWLRDKGKPHNRYFSQIQQTLQQSAPGRPIMLVDMDRVDANIEKVRQHVSDTSKVRLVAKSLPCPQLLEYLMQQLNTNRLMVFHQPFLNQMFSRFTAVDFLIGKPFPKQSLITFLNQVEPGNQNRIEKIQWLIDSEKRLHQYLQIAQQRKLQLNISIEIDTGLHRGGLKHAKEATPLLEMIKNNPQHLKLAGFMAYEPHLAKAPLSILQASGREKMLKSYAEFVALAKIDYPELVSDVLCCNSAGSMTYQLYPESDRGVINDISIGSAFVKTSDFDLPTLADHQPAMFIATPVLKKHSGLTLPFAEGLSTMVSRLNNNLQQSYFTYGGWWKAEACSPQGLKNNGLYGRSTNQELLVGSPKTALNVDDYVFLRPTQSEFVMLQFGQLHMLRGQKIEQRWATFQQDY